MTSLLLSCVLLAATPQATSDWAGAYAGAARHASGLELDVAIVLAHDADEGWSGTIDVPLQGVQGLPLADLVIDEATLQAVLPGASAMVLRAEFDETGTTLTGELRQGELRLAIELERDDDYGFEPIARPQHPLPPFPYRTRDLVAHHPAGHTLAGTLTLPDPELYGPGPYGTAVLISGGGREDRDSSALGHKPFLVIADYLTREGLAVFRFDDRGVGQSRATEATPVGKDATSLLHATDTSAVVRRLRQEPELAPDRIGLIGHSEGGMIAPLVTLMDPEVAFIVLLAGPGAPGASVFRKQLELEWELQGADEATVRTLSSILQSLQAAIVTGEPRDRLLALEQELADAWAASGLGEDDGDANALRDQLRQFDSPWWRFAFGYDPGPVLAAVDCPVLALNGTKDRQVWHTQNLDRIEAAVRGGGGDVTAIRYEDRNHLFQPTETGAQHEYAKIEITFDERVLEDIVRWLGEKLLL